MYNSIDIRCHIRKVNIIFACIRKKKQIGFEIEHKTFKMVTSLILIYKKQ